jgi:hypothetical protein
MKQVTGCSRLANGRSLRLRIRARQSMGMAAPIYYTADMVRGLPDDRNRYETVRGELLVTPAPRLWHVEIWTPDQALPAVEQQRLIWHPAGAAQPFVLLLDELFRPI